MLFKLSNSLYCVNRHLVKLIETKTYFPAWLAKVRKFAFHKRYFLDIQFGKHITIFFLPINTLMIVAAVGF